MGYGKLYFKKYLKNTNKETHLKTLLDFHLRILLESRVVKFGYNIKILYYIGEEFYLENIWIK